MRWSWTKLLVAPAVPAVPAPPPKPFNRDDVDQVLARIAPLADRGYDDEPDAHITFYADGTVLLMVGLELGGRLTGKGKTLAQAVASLTKKSRDIATALKG